jgi:hypothetical protein
MKIWCETFDDKNYTDAKMSDLTKLRGVKLLRGAIGSKAFPSDVYVEIRSSTRPTDFFRAGIFWIISAKLRSLLDSHNVESEYFPVGLRNKRGQELEGNWFCFNPTLILDWFDWSDSRFKMEQNFATEIKKLKSKPDGIGRHPLAVAARTIPVLIALSDELARDIIECGCTGVVFRDIKDWKDPVDPV